jgi:outer membrane receptor protein involved in Fe transport
VELNVDGGPGKDTLVVNAPGNVDPGASLIANLIGGPIKLKKNDTDRDSIVVNYAVVLRGILALDLDGGAGDDRIAVNVTANGGSTGLLQADLFGRAGDDRLRIGVRGVAVDAIQSDVFLKGGPGTDRALHTDNIDLADIKGCEIDTVID